MSRLTPEVRVLEYHHLGNSISSSLADNGILPGASGNQSVPWPVQATLVAMLDITPHQHESPATPISTPPGTSAITILRIHNIGPYNQPEHATALTASRPARDFRHNDPTSMYNAPTRTQMHNTNINNNIHDKASNARYSRYAFCLAPFSFNIFQSTA